MPVTRTLLSRTPAILRSFGLPAALITVFVSIAVIVHGHYPIQHWLFWRYASYWAAAASWSLACLASGRALIRLLIPRPASLLEDLVMSQAIGTLLFFAGMFGAGLLGLYGAPFAIAWPVLLLAGGLFLKRRFWRNFLRHLVTSRRPRPAPSPWLMLAFAAGLIGLAAIYFTVLTPENASYDARWYHLRLGEHYAGARAVTRFPEGWYQSTLPHLGSFLYCWAFQLPGTNLFDRVELCAHLEFVVLLWTMISIPPLVRRLVGKTRAPWSVFALFLFPKLFGYDSGLTVAADHLAAFWAIPVFLALIGAWRTLDVRSSVLLSLMLSGAILTKYQSMYLWPLPIAAYLTRAAWLAVSAGLLKNPHARAQRFLAGPAAAALAGALVTAPHWLKNLLWYGDPLYPFLYRHLPVRPWTVDSAAAYENVFQTQMWPAVGSLAEKATASASAMATFAIYPNDWGTMFNKVPVFGFLFTGSLLVLPFLRRTRWTWALSAGALLGVFVWYWTHHQDRYLQIILPWMAASTAATMVIVWRTALLNRILIGALVGLQVIWGSDVTFASQHGMDGNQSILPVVVRLLGAGNKGNYTDRFKFGEHDLYAVGRTLRPGHKALVHETHLALGLRVPAVMDCTGWQGGLSYGRIPSPMALNDQLASYGVTHLVWHTEHSRGYDSIAGDLKFFWFTRSLGVNPEVTGGLTVARLPYRVMPEQTFPETVAFLACDGTYDPGLYRLDSLVVPATGKHDRSEYPQPVELLSPGREMDLLSRAQLVVHDPKCARVSGKVNVAGLSVLARRNHLTLYSR